MFVILFVGVIIVVLFYLLRKRSSHIPILIRQSARWATAAKQDQNPLIATLHANYAAGYLWALTDIATEKEIESIGGINLTKFKKEVLEVQDFTTRKLSEACPQFPPPMDYLASIAAEQG